METITASDIDSSIVKLETEAGPEWFMALMEIADTALNRACCTTFVSSIDEEGKWSSLDVEDIHPLAKQIVFKVHDLLEVAIALQKGTNNE